MPDSDADGVGDGPTEGLGQPVDQPGGDLGDLRPGQRRGHGRLIGAQHRRHCHHRKNVSRARH